MASGVTVAAVVVAIVLLFSLIAVALYVKRTGEEDVADKSRGKPAAPATTEQPQGRQQHDHQQHQPNQQQQHAPVGEYTHKEYPQPVAAPSFYAQTPGEERGQSPPGVPPGGGPEYNYQALTDGALPQGDGGWAQKHADIAQWEGVSPAPAHGEAWGAGAHPGGHLPVSYRPLRHSGYSPPVSKEQMAKVSDLLSNGFITPAQMLLRDPDIPVFDEDGNVNTFRNRLPMYYEARPDVLGGVRTLPDGQRRVDDMSFDFSRHDPDVDPYQYERDYPGFLPHAPPGYQQGWDGNVQALGVDQDVHDRAIFQPLMGGAPVSTRLELKEMKRSGRQPASLEVALNPSILPDANRKRDALPNLPFPTVDRQRPPAAAHRLRGGTPRTFAVPDKAWEEELEIRQAELRAAQEARLRDGDVTVESDYDVPEDP